MIGRIARGSVRFICEIRVILGSVVGGFWGVILLCDFIVCVEMK